MVLGWLQPPSLGHLDPGCRTCCLSSTAFSALFRNTHRMEGWMLYFCYYELILDTVRVILGSMRIYSSGCVCLLRFELLSVSVRRSRSVAVLTSSIVCVLLCCPVWRYRSQNCCVNVHLIVLQGVGACPQVMLSWVSDWDVILRLIRVVITQSRFFVTSRTP